MPRGRILILKGFSITLVAHYAPSNIRLHCLKVVADCLVIESFGLVVDEASLTGEAEPIKKDRSEDPWVRSGTQVGWMTATDETAWHRVMPSLILEA